MLKILSSLLLFVILIVPAAAETQTSAGPFPDVPADHWAADAVKEMSDSGIMKGYPVGEFKGEKPITRFELAVAMERLVQFVEASRKPLTPATDSQKKNPAKESKANAADWAQPSLQFLTSGGFLPKDSPLLKDGNRPVDGELLAQSFASVASRLATLEADRKADGNDGQPTDVK